MAYHGNSTGSSQDSGRWLAGIILALAELICSAALAFATIALSNSANQIADLQNTIAKGSQVPEFAYLGPEKQSTVPEDGYLIPVARENNYGMQPRFAKTAGFADDMSASAYMYYELTISNLGNSPEAGPKNAQRERRIVSLEVHGTNHSSQVSLDEGATVLSISESGSEDLNFNTLATALANQGYHLDFVKAYFVETICYTDVVGASCEKTYYVTHPSKSMAVPASLFERVSDDPIMVVLDRSQPNLGLPNDFPTDIVDECISKFSN